MNKFETTKCMYCIHSAELSPKKYQSSELIYIFSQNITNYAISVYITGYKKKLLLRIYTNLNQDATSICISAYLFARIITIHFFVRFNPNLQNCLSHLLLSCNVRTSYFIEWVGLSVTCDQRPEK